MKSIATKLDEIIAEQFDVGPEEDGTILLTDIFKETFKADDLDMVEIVMEIEDEFEISIPDKDSDKWKAVGDAYSYLCDKLGETGYYEREKEKDYETNRPIDNRFEILDLRE